MALQLLPALIEESVPALLGTLARLVAPTEETIRQLRKVRRISRRMCRLSFDCAHAPSSNCKERQTEREREWVRQTERGSCTDQSAGSSFVHVFSRIALFFVPFAVAVCLSYSYSSLFLRSPLFSSLLLVVCMAYDLGSFARARHWRLRIGV